MPATPRQIKELMGHLSRSLPDRLKWMPASQMQRLISNPQSLILEPITTRLQESFEVFQAQILALRQNISLPGVPSCTLGNVLPGKIKDVTIKTHEHPDSFPKGLSLATVFPSYPRRRAASFRAFCWMLNHYEFLSLVKEGKFGCEESQVHTFAAGSVMSPLHIIDLIRRSEKGDYLLSRTDGAKNFAIVSDGRSYYACQFTRSRNERGVTWFLSFDHLEDHTRHSGAHYVL